MLAIQEPGTMPVPTDPVLPPEVPPNPSETGPREPINVPSPGPEPVDDPGSPEPLGIPGDTPNNVPDPGPSIVPSDQPGTTMAGATIH